MELLRLFLPVLFPSWRFFAEIEASPRVEVEFTPGEWRDAMERPLTLSVQDRIWRLVWNPDWNEALFLSALAERLLVDPEPWIEGEIANRLMARYDLANRPNFRIALVTPEGREVAVKSHAD